MLCCPHFRCFVLSVRECYVPHNGWGNWLLSPYLVFCDPHLMIEAFKFVLDPKIHFLNTVDCFHPSSFLGPIVCIVISTDYNVWFLSSIPWFYSWINSSVKRTVSLRALIYSQSPWSVLFSIVLLFDIFNLNVHHIFHLYHSCWKHFSAGYHWVYLWFWGSWQFRSQLFCRSKLFFPSLPFN